MCYTYSTEYDTALQKEGNYVIWDTMNGTERYYAKWNKPSTGSQILYDINYMRNLRVILIETEQKGSYQRLRGEMGNGEMIQGYKVSVGQEE